MNIYLVSFWLPYPSSEYGGLQVIAARTREELKEILLNHSSLDDYNKKCYHKWKNLIDRAVEEAQEITPFTIYNLELGVIREHLT